MFLIELQPFKELNPCRVTLPKRNSNKRQDVLQSTNNDVTCLSSFLEAFKSITECDLKDTFKYLNLRKFSCEEFNILLNFSQHKSNVKRRKKWFEKCVYNDLALPGVWLPHQKLSYQTSQTYFKHLERKMVNNILFSPHPSIPVGVQIRGFKIQRNHDSHKEDDLVSRLRSGLKHSQIKINSVVENNAYTSDRMASYLEDETLSKEDKQRMKIAFAEGYLMREKKNKPSTLFRWVQLIAAIVVIHAIFLYIMVNSSNPMLRLPKSDIEVDADDIKVTFNDVRGAEEAKQELKDVVQFLKNPEKFTSLGAKLPRGVLLVGPPGTGKTLLARAVAGEAGVPFFHTAGPEFDEVLVGQGARRVRDLFKAAKEKSPCVVFIDEIDSVGSKRTNSVLHPYANQTINQLLTEMDGFQQSEGIIVLGATNRKEELDGALLRPGRFDMEVDVPIPDLSGRKDILSLYLSRIECGQGIDVEVLARGTTGFTGADLNNMVNQAALRAAIDGLSSVSMKYLENARDKVLMGPERKTRLPDEEANTITAYHESGHAVVAFFTKGSNPLHKVTIIPRGQSLGHTAYIPEKDMYHVTKSQLLALVDTMMGGRAAEEIIFGPDKITSGASSDLKQATIIATRMVKEWGMSEKAGLRTYPSNESSLINELGHQATEKIDSEIQRLLHESYARAKSILEAHRLEHKLLAEALLKYETLNAADVKAIMNTKNPLPPPPPMIT